MIQLQTVNQNGHIRNYCTATELEKVIGSESTAGGIITVMEDVEPEQEPSWGVRGVQARPRLVVIFELNFTGFLTKDEKCF